MIFKISVKFDDFFIVIFQKNQSPHSLLTFGMGSINGDFDFFGESHGFTPKTPMYILELCEWVFFF